MRIRFQHGVPPARVIDPRGAKAIIYRSLTDVSELGADGALDIL